MKNRRNVKRYYAMSIVDGRTAIATRELLTNPDYRIVSEEIANKVERKLIDWRKVAFELRQRDSMNPAELIKRAEQEKVKNLRISPVTRENVEQFETQMNEDEIGEVFDGAADAEPAEGEEASPKEKAAGKGKSAGKAKNAGKGKAKEASAPAPAEAETAEGEEAPPEDLDI